MSSDDDGRVGEFEVLRILGLWEHGSRAELLGDFRRDIGSRRHLCAGLGAGAFECAARGGARG